MRRRASVALLLGGRLCAGPQTVSSYHVGNSLTWDSQPEAIAAMSAARGISHAAGYHIRCGSSLPMIAADTVTCVDPVEQYGLHEDALPGFEWDVVTLQVHPVSTFGADREAVSHFIAMALENPANRDTRFYLYEAWPQTGVEGTPYAEMWERDAGAEDSEEMIYSRAYFANLLDSVRADHPGVSVGLIPAGEVLYAMDAKLQSGALVIPGYTSANNLYRDPQRLHLNNVGRWAAAVTTWAVLTGKDPTGLTRPAGFFDGNDRGGVVLDSRKLTPAVQAAIVAIVREVLATP